MAEMVLKLQGVEITLSATANTVGLASFVRVYNATAAAIVLTKQNVVANTANATITVGTLQEVFVNKAPTDTLTSPAALLATPVKLF